MLGLMWSGALVSRPLFNHAFSFFCHCGYSTQGKIFTKLEPYRHDCLWHYDIVECDLLSNNCTCYLCESDKLQDSWSSRNTVTLSRQPLMTFGMEYAPRLTGRLCWSSDWSLVGAQERIKVGCTTSADLTGILTHDYLYTKCVF